MVAKSNATTTNPKDLLGNKKVPMGAVLPVAQAHESLAMLDGELKYGYRNWRSKSVVARIYIDAAKRHINAWEEMEEYAPDSGVHHLGHARACLGILLDAQETGNLIDDRAPGVFSKVTARLEEWVANRRQKHAEKQQNCAGPKDRRIASMSRRQKNVFAPDARRWGLFDRRKHD